MKLEDQICSLELAKKLKELYVGYKSIYCYFYSKRMDRTFGEFHSYIDNYDRREDFIEFVCYGYTVSELMDLLPTFIIIDSLSPHDCFYLEVHKRTYENIRYCAKYVCSSMDGKEVDNPLFQRHCPAKSHDSNLADCLAKLLIYLIEKEHVKL